MADAGRRSAGVVIPAMRYRDAPAAVEWLCRAFGFERHLVVPDDQGGIAHAQLVFGNGMIMLGSMRDDAFGALVTHPDATGGRETQSPYIIVPASEIDAHYARARAEGAAMVMDIRDEDYGGRGYSCRDPEGRLWNFGSYDPWQAPRPGSQPA